MKRTFAALLLLPALPLLADGTLVLNKPMAEEIVCDNESKTFALAEEATVQAASTVVLTGELTFFLPTEDPAYDNEAANSKLLISVDSQGEIIVANAAEGGKWEHTGYLVTDGTTVAVRAVGCLSEGALCFTVTISPKAAEAGSAVDSAAAKTVEVVSPASGSALAGLCFSGVGSASGVTLALVDPGILPPAADGGTQNAALVEKYVAWANDPEKGGALGEGATAEAQQNAFAMNVGGTPSLTITAIDPTERTVTITGSYAAAEGETAVDLKTINGVLTLASRETLSGSETLRQIDVSAAANGKAVKVPFPEEARFVKAAVSVNPPADAATATAR